MNSLKRGDFVIITSALKMKYHGLIGKIVFDKVGCYKDEYYVNILNAPYRCKFKRSELEIIINKQLIIQATFEQ